MKVIFTQDVRGRGKRGQVKDVPDGYAQNYLIKRGLAKEATKGNMNTLKRVEANEKAAYEAEKAEAEKIKAELEKDDTVVNFKSKAGTDSRLFGSISSKKIVEGLEKQYGIKVDKRKLSLRLSTLIPYCFSRLINASLTCQNQLRLWAILMFMPNYLRV